MLWRQVVPTLSLLMPAVVSHAVPPLVSMGEMVHFPQASLLTRGQCVPFLAQPAPSLKARVTGPPRVLSAFVGAACTVLGSGQGTVVSRGALQLPCARLGEAPVGTGPAESMTRTLCFLL